MVALQQTIWKVRSVEDCGSKASGQNDSRCRNRLLLFLWDMNMGTFLYISRTHDVITLYSTRRN